MSVFRKRHRRFWKCFCRSPPFPLPETLPLQKQGLAGLSSCSWKQRIWLQQIGGGTSDPYVRVQYGNIKKRTKVVYKTLNPQWNQTLEFPDTGSPLVLHVRDHNAVLPTSNIGDCKVEYERLPPNKTVDKWIPLQGVKKGEIRVQVTRRVPEKKQKTRSSPSSSGITTVDTISGKVRMILKKVQSMAEDGDPEKVCLTLDEL
ncbi:hypothetical protein KI387_009871, partial [Taxus chinensis]